MANNEAMAVFALWDDSVLRFVPRVESSARVAAGMQGHPPPAPLPVAVSFTILRGGLRAPASKSSLSLSLSLWRPLFAERCSAEAPPLWLLDKWR